MPLNSIKIKFHFLPKLIRFTTSKAAFTFTPRQHSVGLSYNKLSEIIAKFRYLETTPRKKKSHSGRNWGRIKFGECAPPLCSEYFCLPRVPSNIKKILKSKNYNFCVAYYDDKRGHPQPNWGIWQQDAEENIWTQQSGSYWTLEHNS